MTAAPSGDASGFALEDLLEILERRKAWIALAAVLGVALGLVAYWVLPPWYTARTTILVEPQEVPESYVAPTVTLTVEHRLQTLQERVTSYASLNEIIDRIGTEALDPSGRQSREEIMNRIRGGLKVSTSTNLSSAAASVFEIAYTGRDPQLVAEVAREIAGLFISENVKERTRQATETAAFLDRELERLRGEVTTYEERLRTFRQERMGALPDQLDANLRGLDRLNLELAANLESQEAVAQRAALLRRQLEGVPAAGGVGAGELGRAIESTRAELLMARRVYTDEHPNVIRLQRELEQLEAQAAAGGGGARGGAILDPAARSLLGEIEAANVEAGRRKRQEESLRQQIAELQARVEETPSREQELQSLTRDYTNLTETYQQLLSKKFEAAIARNLEQAQKGERFKVLRPARVPDSPSFPSLQVCVPGGLAVALGLCALWIGVQEWRFQAFRSVNRLTRAIGLPVIASIPRIDDERIFVEAPSGDVDPRLVVWTAPESAPAEQYRGFAPLFLEDPARRVVLVTSAARGDGKSLTTMNLALTFACDLNRRVLLIDSDLRRPTAHRLVRISRRRGLSDVLRGQATLDDAAVNSKLPNLTVLPAGPSVRSPLALLTGQRFLDLLAEAREKYDVVFIDSPPLLPVVDTRFLKRLADMVIFVVRADATPRDAVVRSMREMKDVAGVIFNQVSPGSFQRYYYYDAYSRYAYGEPGTGEEALQAEAGTGDEADGDAKPDREGA